MTHTRPAFAKEGTGGFYQGLRKRAASTLVSHRQRARILTWSEVILFPAALVATYSLLLLKGENPFWLYGCYAMYGIIVPFMVLNVVHGAVHNSLFESARANRLAAHALELVGASSFIWGRRHVQLHHTYTNIPGWDVDIENRTVIRLTPTDPHRWGHRFQHLYLPFLYPFYTLVWLFVRDFRDAFSKSCLVGRTIRIPTSERVKLFVFKAIYGGYTVVVPALVLPQPLWAVLLGFLLMHAFSGVLVLLIVLPTHFDEDAPFPKPDASARMQDEWAVHQIRTTNDFSTDRPVFTYMLGALNHHAAHHLFPTVNHNLLPPLTRLVAEAADERNLTYKSFTYMDALRSHYRLLKRNGLSVRAIFEE